MNQIPSSTTSSVFNLTQTAVDREHDKVLAEIEGTELTDLIGTSLRAVYELDSEIEKNQNDPRLFPTKLDEDGISEFGSPIPMKKLGGSGGKNQRSRGDKNGKDNTTSQAKFNEKLKERINQLDYDIELMCNHKYQGFIEALNDLSNFSTQTNTLFDRVSYANSEVQELGAKIATKRREIINFREKQNNISTICATISTCLPLFNAYVRLEQQMQEERYHAALKAVEQIEHVILPGIHNDSPLNATGESSNFSFTSHIEKQVPTIRIRVKEQAGVTFKNFLDLISSSAENIGEVILARHLQQRNFKKAFEAVDLPLVGDPAPLRIKRLDDYYNELANQQSDGFDDDYQRAVLDEDDEDEYDEDNPRHNRSRHSSPMKSKSGHNNPFSSGDSDSDETTAIDKNPFKSEGSPAKSISKAANEDVETSEDDSDDDSDLDGGYTTKVNLPVCNLLKIVSKGKSVLEKDTTMDEETEEELMLKQRLKEISVDELLDFTPIFRTVHIYKLLAETTRKNKSGLGKNPKKEEEAETAMNLNCSNLSLESTVTIVTEEKRKRLEADPNIDLSMTSDTELAVLYRRERRKQARLLLQIMNTRELKTRFAEHYCRFLQRITGFFTIESHLLSTASYLYKPNKLKYSEDGEADEDSQLDVSWLSDAWAWACSKVIMLLRNQLSYQDKASVLLETKDLTMAFVSSAEEAGYESREIMDALPDLWKQYLVLGGKLFCIALISK